MSQLLFEAYRVPAVNFAIDSLLSFAKNRKTTDSSPFQMPQDGLVLSFSERASHIIPIIDSEWRPQESRRIDVGGRLISQFLHDRLQIQYPLLKPQISFPGRVQYLKENFCFISTDFFGDLNQVSRFYQGQAPCPELLRIFQLPTPPKIQPKSSSSSDEVAKAERAIKMRDRLLQSIQKKKDEKV